jgi:hypothetical protein
MIWEELIVRMGEIEILAKFWLESLNERDHSKDPSIDRKIILKWISRK